MNDNELAAKATDLNELLDHIAWKAVIKPELDKVKEAHSRYLFQATLGTKVTDGTGKVLTPIELAGRIYGLEFIEDLFTRILSQGDRALKSMNLHLVQQH